MKNIVLSLCLYIFCFLVIGLYTLIIYLIGQTFWSKKTKGSLIIDKNSNIRGSYLVAQYLEDTRYFKPKPNIEADPKCDMALLCNYDTPSASLYDPFITQAEAILQAMMVAKNWGIDVNKIYKLIEQNILYKQKIFFEIEIVNTSILNAALDDYSN
jgi:K+-transporting ATPase c subunit